MTRKIVEIASLEEKLSQMRAENKRTLSALESRLSELRQDVCGQLQPTTEGEPPKVIVVDNLQGTLHVPEAKQATYELHMVANKQSMTEYRLAEFAAEYFYNEGVARYVEKGQELARFVYSKLLVISYRADVRVKNSNKRAREEHLKQRAAFAIQSVSHQQQQ